MSEYLKDSIALEVFKKYLSTATSLRVLLVHKVIQRLYIFYQKSLSINFGKDIQFKLVRVFAVFRSDSSISYQKLINKSIIS